MPRFDFAGWALDRAGLVPGMRVLDAGCGNGLYLETLRQRGARAVGCDLSLGMLRDVAHPHLVNADVTALPVRDNMIDLVLAAHLLDLVPGRATAVHELRRVLAPSGTCLVVTTGSRHLRSLRNLIEQAVRPGQPGWRVHPPTGAAFTTENAPAQLGAAFRQVTCVRPTAAGSLVIKDATVVSDYVISLADHYQPEVAQPWPEVAADVRSRVQAVIDREGEFCTSGDVAAFICR